jgi:MFS family permease
MFDAAVARYAAFFRLPDVARLLAMAVLARMPLGTVTLALLLHVRALTGSFAAAGVTVGSYLAASAMTGPIIGRWIDRRGVRSALLVTGVVSPTALLLLWIAEPLGFSPAILPAVAAIAGAFAPPITVLTRTMWRYRFEDATARKTAFALDAVLIELSFTVGPALVAVLLAIGSPFVAFGGAWVFAVVAVPTFLASPALRYWRHDPHAERHLLGPLTELRLAARPAAELRRTARQDPFALQRRSQRPRPRSAPGAAAWVPRRPRGDVPPGADRRGHLLSDRVKHCATCGARPFPSRSAWRSRIDGRRRLGPPWDNPAPGPTDGGIRPG